MSEANVTHSSDMLQIERSDEKLKIGNEENCIDDEFDNDDIPNYIREARLNEIKMRAREQQYLQQNKNDIYKEITEEEFLTLTTKSKKCIVHFFHHDFRRCDIMHTHLQKLASKYLDVKIAKINVEKAKFFVNKLSIQVLPAVLCFVDGILKHKIIGFEQLGNVDNFQTKELEKIFWKLKFVKKPEDEEDENTKSDNESDKKKKSSLFSSKTNENDSDSD